MPVQECKPKTKVDRDQFQGCLVGYRCRKLLLVHTPTIEHSHPRSENPLSGRGRCGDI